MYVKYIISILCFWFPYTFKILVLWSDDDLSLGVENRYCIDKKIFTIELVVTVIIYRYCCCYTNGDDSYKIYP
jgi:hypothetical protein